MDLNPLTVVGKLLSNAQKPVKRKRGRNKHLADKMPEKEWMDLYKCKSMNDLKDLSSIRDIEKKYGSLKTVNLKNSLELLKKKAEENEKKKDMESMYICLSRFMELFVYVQKRRASDKEFFMQYFGIYVKKSMTTLSWLTDRLDSRYKKKSEDRGDILSTVLPQDARIIGNETDDFKEKRLKKSEKEIIPVNNEAITCSELKDCLDQGKTILVIDVRSAEMYQQTRIDFNGVKFIYISNESMESIYSPSLIAQSLEGEAKECWEKRKTFDLVVIVDEEVTSTSLKDSVAGKLFKTLTSYDTYPSSYKCLKYLEGGFQEWHHTYPTFCTKSTLKPWEFSKRIDSPSFGKQLDRITYPQIDEPASVHKTIKAPLSNGAFNSTSLINIPQLPSIKPTPVVNRETKPSFGRTVSKPAEFLNQNGHSNEIEVNADKISDNEKNEPESGNILQTTKSNNITVDRTTKPSGLKTSQSVVDKENQIAKTASPSSKDGWSRNSSGTTLEPLKLDSSSSASNMKRSSSVPNISKLIEEEDELSAATSAIGVTPPKYDRAAKPSAASSHQLSKTRGYHDFGYVATDKPRAATDAHDTGISVSSISRGVTGLKNLGNTCYMNSIVQCLSNTVELHHDIIQFNDGRIKPRMGSVANELYKVVRLLWAGKHKNFPCSELKNVVGKRKTTFRGYEQQDSHEFLTILLDWLHEDLNEPNPHLELSGACDETGERAWGEFRRKNNSLVMDLFYGQLKSTVRCSECGKESVTFEPFSNLSLLLPNKHPDYCTLDECLELYLREESIAGWNCPNCKSARNATKKIDISKLPPILVIHLKRFTSSGTRKKQTEVDFPVTESLDMLRYAAPVNSEQRHRFYHLYAVSNHYGSMESGHYTAYCLNSGLKRWYKFDDTEVFEIQPNNVKTSAAYILFYSAISNS